MPSPVSAAKPAVSGYVPTTTTQATTSAPLTEATAPLAFGRRRAVPIGATAGALAGIFGPTSIAAGQTAPTPAPAVTPEAPAFMPQSTAQSVPGIPHGVVSATEVFNAVRNAGNIFSQDGWLDYTESKWMADYFQGEVEKYGKLWRQETAPSERDYYKGKHVEHSFWMEFFRRFESQTKLGGPVSTHPVDVYTAVSENNVDNTGNITHNDLDNRNLEIQGVINYLATYGGTMEDWRFIHLNNTLTKALSDTEKYFNEIAMDLHPPQ
ncbi:MAG: hypothetical protein AB7P76_10210 [Candidatus Melainabacteria bacterium]